MMEGVFQETPNRGARKLGGETSRHHSLEELKYLARRADFHHSGGPKISHQESFSPREVFMRLGSLIAKPPLLRG
jgi:hypothetical protein